ncbi:hypothetical protein LCGC14_1889850 [marine sediment metagenome]|uniref:Uncharacterized protein n=1 Tax=marine sediment metagenome TaxID=412755 RepID=A0A0F9FZS2_9ZZZZ
MTDAERAEELAESWINGNKSHVIQEVRTGPPLLAVKVYEYLGSGTDPDYDQGLFSRMLKSATE